MEFDDRPEDLNKLRRQAQIERKEKLLQNALTWRGGKRKTKRAKKKKGRQTRRKRKK